MAFEQGIHQRGQRWRTGSLATLAIAVLIFLVVPMRVADPDLWWHLRNAEYLVHTHHQITRDMYSYTAAGAAWMNHEWLAELPFYAAWHAFGPVGAYLLTLGLSEAILLSVFALCLYRSRDLAASVAATGMAALFATVSLAPRTLLFGWLLLVAELLTLAFAAKRKQMLWLLPPMFAVWVNTHGSWSIGLVLLFVYFAANLLPLRLGALRNDPEERVPLKLAASILCASIAALFVNPYGWRLAVYPLNLAFRQKLNVGHVAEWQPLDLHSPRGVLLLGSIGLLALWQLWRNRTWKPADFAFLAIGLYSALCYSRFLFLLGIVAAPVIAVQFRRERQTRQGSPMRASIWLGTAFVMLCVVYSRARSAAPIASTTEQAFPSGAVAYIAKHPLQGRLLNDYTWGGYLIWTVRQVPVFIDPRADIFEWNGTFRDYLDITHLNNTLALLDHYHIRYLLMSPEDPLVYLLEHVSGWKVDFQDRRSILLERAHAEGGAASANHSS